MQIPQVNIEQLRALLGQGLPVVLLLTSKTCGKTCGYCKISGLLLEGIADGYAGRVNFARVGLEEEAIVRLVAPDIRAVPRHVFLADRKVTSRIDGAAPVHEIRRWIDEALASVAK